MITIYSNFISKSECEELISYYKQNTNLIIKTINDQVYHYNGMYITEKISSFNFTKRFLEKQNILKVRIQHLDNQINMVESPHGHSTQYNFVAFLNDDFEGGELIFDNLIIEPKMGQLIYFTGNELHYVKKVFDGNRYSLIGMSHSNIEMIKPILM